MSQISCNTKENLYEKQDPQRPFAVKYKTGIILPQVSDEEGVPNRLKRGIGSEYFKNFF